MGTWGHTALSQRPPCQSTHSEEERSLLFAFLKPPKKWISLGQGSRAVPGEQGWLPLTFPLRFIRC